MKLRNLGATVAVSTVLGLSPTLLAGEQMSEPVNMKGSADGRFESPGTGASSKTIRVLTDSPMDQAKTSSSAIVRSHK